MQPLEDSAKTIRFEPTGVRLSPVEGHRLIADLMARSHADPLSAPAAADRLGEPRQAAAPVLVDDALWAVLAPFLVRHGGGRGRPSACGRAIFQGILWVASSGRAWRRLPRRFGKWNSVYRQFVRWTGAGVWEALAAALASAPAAAPEAHLALDLIRALSGRPRLPAKRAR